MRRIFKYDGNPKVFVYLSFERNRIVDIHIEQQPTPIIRAEKIKSNVDYIFLFCPISNRMEAGGVQKLCTLPFVIALQ